VRLDESLDLRLRLGLQQVGEQARLTNRITTSATAAASTHRAAGAGRIPGRGDTSTKENVTRKSYGMNVTLAVFAETFGPTQLPVLIRGIYYEEWDPARVPIKMSRDELPAYQPIRDAGEWEDVASTLPKDVAATLPAGR
jgi:hypothetical protein